jgi:hypothetical protein
VSTGRESDGDPRLPPEDPRVSYSQILRLQDRIRQILAQLQAELDSPAVRTIVAALEEERGSHVAAPVSRLRQVLLEVTDVVEDASREVAAELAQLSGEASPAAEELPLGLARFVAERSSVPGFSYETHRDFLRGWTVVWREELEDGSVRAGGLLYERPHAWVQD